MAKFLIVGEIDDDKANLTIILFLTEFYRKLFDYKYDKFFLREDLENLVGRSLSSFEGKANVRWVVLPRQI